MTPQTLAQIQQQAVALNSADKPYAIKAEATQIVGTWNILDANWLGIISANHADKDYSITFDLDDVTHQFSYKEHSGSSNSKLSISPDGSVSFGSSSSTFSGKQFGSHSVGTTIGIGMQNKDEPAQVVGAATYNFDNGQIKKPLLAILQQGGWTEKKSGLLKKLFG